MFHDTLCLGTWHLDVDNFLGSLGLAKITTGYANEHRTDGNLMGPGRG
jgi:hypothetical protein